MSYSVKSASEEEFSQWNTFVSRSSQANPFHRRHALEVLAEQTNTTLHPLIGLKGEQVIGLFPIFTTTRGPFRLVLSPPLQTILNLGPVLIDTGSLKQRKIERRNRLFIDECFDWIGRHFDPHYLDIRTTERYIDLRPFKEHHCTLAPYYTHVVDIGIPPSELIKLISKHPRSVIQNTDPDTYHIEIGECVDARMAAESIFDRHGDDAEGIEIDGDFIERLYTRLPDGTVRPYVCYDAKGAAVGRKVTVESGDTILLFRGGAKPSGELPANELLDWHIIQDGHDRGYHRYDLVGGNALGISRYKAKFAPRLLPYFKVKKMTPSTRVALGTREKLKPLATGARRTAQALGR